MNKVIERLLNLLAFLLTTDRPVTVDEIRQTVAGYDQTGDEAFRRMFERDKDTLRQLGVPLHLRPTDAWEVEWGYVVPPGDYELADPGLTDEERAALWLAAQAVRLGAQPPGPEAIFKLGGAPLAGAVEPLGADLGADLGRLADLFAAVTDRRRLRFRYRDSDRQVAPYGLVHRRGHWYLVGASIGRDAGSGGGDGADIRVYRVDRMEQIEAGDEAGAFQRPEGFRARDHLAAAPWEAGPEDLAAVVRFDPEVAWWARRQLPAHAVVDDVEDGGFEARLTVANPDAFVGWLLGFVDQAEVLEPPQLRELVLARLEPGP